MAYYLGGYPGSTPWRTTWGGYPGGTPWRTNCLQRPRGLLRPPSPRCAYWEVLYTSHEAGVPRVPTLPGVLPRRYSHPVLPGRYP